MRYEPKFGFRPVFTTCTEGDISTLERELGHPLPGDYREFLKQCNGGVFSLPPGYEVIVPVGEWEGDFADAVQVFFGISKVTNEILENLASYRFDERVPSHIIPIGTNCFSVYFCLSLAGNDRGTIYLWQGTPEWDEKDGYDDLYPISNSFREFWDSLYVEHNGVRVDEVPPRATPSLEVSSHQFTDKLGLQHVSACCDTADVISVERWLEAELPTDYRAFLLQHNRLRFSVVLSVGNAEVTTIKRLFGARSRSLLESIIDFHSSSPFVDRIPKGHVAIGETADTRLILMSLSENNRGEILLCREQTRWDEINPSKDPYRLVPTGCASFTEFWDNLRPRDHAN